MEETQQRRAAATSPPSSPWSPLVWPTFRALWLATLISNTGGWMQDVGASWLMTSLSRSATLIALVQAAESLPMFLLAIPAGALADIVERRLLMLAGNLVSLGAVVALSVCTYTGWISPALLLWLTFAVGFGEALEGPASQAVVTELVPRSELARAVSLNSAGQSRTGRGSRGWRMADRQVRCDHNFSGERPRVLGGDNRALPVARGAEEVRTAGRAILWRCARRAPLRG